MLYSGMIDAPALEILPLEQYSEPAHLCYICFTKKFNSNSLGYLVERFTPAMVVSERWLVSVLRTGDHQSAQKCPCQ